MLAYSNAHPPPQQNPHMPSDPFAAGIFVRAYSDVALRSAFTCSFGSAEIALRAPSMSEYVWPLSKSGAMAMTPASAS